MPQNGKARDESVDEAILIPISLARSLSLGLESEHQQAGFDEMKNATLDHCTAIGLQEDSLRRLLDSAQTVMGRTGEERQAR